MSIIHLTSEELGFLLSLFFRASVWCLSWELVKIFLKLFLRSWTRCSWKTAHSWPDVLVDCIPAYIKPKIALWGMPKGHLRSFQLSKWNDFVFTKPLDDIAVVMRSRHVHSQYHVTKPMMFLNKRKKYLL